MSTDTDWDKWGEIDPYFGVLSSDEYRADNLNEELRAKFFHSGDVYIRRTLDAVRSHLDAGYQPERCVDFGCGVGRLVIPLAGLSREVVGIDVSDHMLAEAASNCEKRNVENVALVKSDDRLTQLDGSFNLIRGRPLQEPAMQLHTYDLEAILCLLKAAGVASIYLHPFTHDEFQSVTLYGQKSDRHSVSESTTTT